MLLLEEEKKNLLKTLRSKGIEDEKLLNVFYKVPREKFVPLSMRKFAYDDNALPIESMQTISQPFTVAYMTKALDIQPSDKILEIGTGSGYQAAVLCELGADVFTVARIENLYNSSKKLLNDLGYKVQTKLDDGTMGWPENAPFDKIIVTAGAPRIPSLLVEQLKTGGKMVVPIGERKSQKLHVITRNDAGIDYKVFEGFKFVPLIGKEGWTA